MACKRRKLNPAVAEAIESRLMLSAYACADLGVFGFSSDDDALNTPVADASGNLFGVDFGGGVDTDGAIYKIAAGSQTVTTLASFLSTNGKGPQPNLVVDGSGNVYGIAYQGGAQPDDGTLFEIPAGTSTITTLVNFNGAGNGAVPYGGLLLASNGNIYGSTEAGGSNNDGTLFKFNLQTQTLTTLYSMSSSYYQPSMLARDGSGNLYGTLYEGGTDEDGAVFKLTPGGVFSTIVNFNYTNGSEPTGLVVDSSGDLFGTTTEGGSDGGGTLYEIRAGTTSLTTLFSFTYGNGFAPTGSLAIDSHGNLFGSTRTAGANDKGLIYEVPAGTSSPVVLDLFGGFGSNLRYPSSSVYVDSHGNVYAAVVSDSLGYQNQVIKLYTSTPSQIVATQQPQNYIAGSNTSVTVQVEDALGNPIVTDSAPLSMSVASGPAGAIINTPAVTPQGGMAQLNVDPTVAGVYTLAIADGEAAAGITASFTVSASTEVGLKFGQMPSAATIDAPLTPLYVETVDQFGNVVETDNTSVVVVSLASNPNFAALAGTLTATCDEGVATFDNISINNVGNYELAAVGGVGLPPALSPVFSVGPLPVSKLVVASAPSVADAGQMLGPIVIDLEDANSAIVTGDTRAITLSIVNASGTVTGSTTANAVAGVATFANVSIAAAGNYTLTAADSQGTPAASFTVQIVVPPIPSVTAGVRLPAIQMAIAPVTGHPKAKQVATISIETGPTGAKLLGTRSSRVTNATATFGHLMLTTAGSYTLKITDAAGIVATLNRVVTPSAATRLVFVSQPPAATASGAAFSTSVEAVDRFGNVETSDADTLTLQLISSKKKSASLTGTAAQSVTNGIDLFSDQAIGLPGTYRLVVKATGVKQSFSKTFKIV